MGIVDDIVEESRRSRGYEAAFHNLRELDLAFLPDMRTAYRREEDPEVRALIVHAAWQQRPVSVVDFLAEALQDPVSEVWKQALDGLVALASSDVKRVLQGSADREENRERRAWIAEAIEQVHDAVSRHK